MEFTVNGRPVFVDLPDEVPLIHVLRDELGLFGTRFGCGAEGCGACMVLVDGEPRYACTLGLSAVRGRAVRTVEGLGGEGCLSALQQAFLAEQAGQCGYCLSGILMSATALLERDPAPEDAAILAALDPHLCRCGTHSRILRAVRRAAEALRSGAA